MEERRGVYRVLVGRPEGKKPFGKPRPRWQVKIKVDFLGNAMRVIWIGSSWLRIGRDSGKMD